MSLGYSDKVNHALAFAVKYYRPRAPTDEALSYLGHPANMGMILARYGSEDATVIAGILHPVLAETPPDAQHSLRHKVADKFGSTVISTLTDAYEPRLDARGQPRTWRIVKLEYLGQLTRARPAALDVCTASEIHLSGSLLARVRRLGREYLPAVTAGAGRDVLWWYHALIDALEHRHDWTNRRMVQELRLHAADLARLLKEGPDSATA